MAAARRQGTRGPEDVEYAKILLSAGQSLDPKERSSAGRWASAEYRRGRDEARSFDAQEVDPPNVNLDEVQRIVEALQSNATTRSAMAAASDNIPAESPSYVTLAELGEVGPPAGIPILIEEIGVLAVPIATQEAGVENVEAAIKSVGGGHRVEPEITYHRAAALELGEMEAVGQSTEYLLDGEGMTEEWLEAALEASAAAEVLPWGVAHVRAPAVWARGFRGQGIRVAVVDTGVGPHIDLPRPVAGATFVPGSHSFHDDNGHGTHVAGTIAARQNGQGVIGVAPRADLLAAKVLNRMGSGSDTGVAAGIVWAANHGAHIINLSLGGGFSAAIQRAVRYARTVRKVTLCVAAGNNFPGRINYPGADPLVICVEAIERTNRRCQFSCVGPEMDIAAPGCPDILSTWLNNSYRAIQGTSMATPHVAGVAALLLSRVLMDPGRVQRRLEGNALPLGPANQFGKGLVQADRAVLFPRPGTAIAGERNGANGGAMEEDLEAERRKTTREPARAR